MKDRFAFGQNWENFLGALDSDRIEQAKRSLCAMLKVSDLNGRTFLDVGCGSGLFSLAARMLGAHVYSFDYDPKSVNCALTLKDRYFKDDSNWQIAQGSILDTNYLKTLGQFDYIYSWGVLHHTGQMWQALENVIPLVNEKGVLFIAIYNDQGAQSKLWLKIKKAYNNAGYVLKKIILGLTFFLVEGLASIVRLVTFQNPLPFGRWAKRRKERGMSIWYDHVDWIGGYPFEVATPDQIFRFYKDRGFDLVELVTRLGGWGCNEFVFKRSGLD